MWVYLIWCWKGNSFNVSLISSQYQWFLFILCRSCSLRHYIKWGTAICLDFYWKFDIFAISCFVFRAILSFVFALICSAYLITLIFFFTCFAVCSVCWLINDSNYYVLCNVLTFLCVQSLSCVYRVFLVFRHAMLFLITYSKFYGRLHYLLFAYLHCLYSTLYFVDCKSLCFH